MNSPKRKNGTTRLQYKIIKMQKETNQKLKDICQETIKGLADKLAGKSLLKKNRTKRKSLILLFQTEVAQTNYPQHISCFLSVSRDNTYPNLIVGLGNKKLLKEKKLHFFTTLSEQGQKEGKLVTTDVLCHRSPKHMESCP